VTEDVSPVIPLPDPDKVKLTGKEIVPTPMYGSREPGLALRTKEFV